VTPNVSAYDRFRALGAVLDVARFPLPTSALHEVPVRAMRVFAQRHDDYLKTLDEARLKKLDPAFDVAKLFRITLDPDVASGRRVLEGEAITARELFGPGYDLETDTIRLFDYRDRARVTTTMEGLAYALLDPPYGLLKLPRQSNESFDTPGHAERAQARMLQLLREFCAEVLSLEGPRRADHLTIHRWPTDWSTYFDAGNEWWGSFCWTVEDHHHGWVTVLAASTTD
jgi:hypothetical protein